METTLRWKVRCQGEWHNVLLLESGKLVFPDHEDIEGEYLIWKLTLYDRDVAWRPVVADGTTKQGCLAFLDAWRSGQWTAIAPSWWCLCTLPPDLMWERIEKIVQKKATRRGLCEER